MFRSVDMMPREPSNAHFTFLDLLFEAASRSVSRRSPGARPDDPEMEMGNMAPPPQGRTQIFKPRYVLMPAKRHHPPLEDDHELIILLAISVVFRYPILF